MKKVLAHVPAPKPPADTPPFRRTRIAGTLALLGTMAGLGLMASRPAHTAGGPIAVNVANTPLPTTPTDVAAPRQPFQASTGYAFVAHDSGGYLDTAGGYKNITVPAGKRLVIQTVSLYETNAAGQDLQASFSTSVNGTFGTYALPRVSDDGTQYPGATQSMTLYSDAGILPFVLTRSTNGASPDNIVILSVSGYLVNV